MSEKGNSPLNEAASTDSDNLPIKVGKLLDNWIEMKEQVDTDGMEQFIQGESLMKKLVPR